MNETFNRLKNWIKLLRKKPLRTQLILATSVYTIAIVFSSLTFGLFVLNFSQPEATRNLLILGAALTSLCFLFWRTRIAARTLTIDQLTLAMQQINSEKMSSRLSGIRILEQIAKYDKEEREKIIQILSARIREIAPPGPTRKLKDRHRYLDIESAVEALANIATPLYIDKYLFCELQETNLSGLRFYGTNLSYFILTDVNFSNTYFSGVDFEGAVLEGANISGINLEEFCGLTQDQINDSFYWEGELPPALPNDLKLPPLKKKPPEEGGFF